MPNVPAREFTNDDRRGWAMQVIQGYKYRGPDDGKRPVETDDDEDTLYCLLADLCHLFGTDVMETAMESAASTYRIESGPQKPRTWCVKCGAPATPDVHGSTCPGCGHAG